MTLPGPLFCPFCRECFEDRDSCPEHELPLVPYRYLPPDPHEPLPFYDLSLGRGWVFLGALLLLVGPAAPFISIARETAEVVSGYEVALRVAPNLWVVPAAAVGLFSVLSRRRAPVSMRAVRVVPPALALLSLVSVIYTLYQIFEGARMEGEEVTLRWGVGVVGCGIVATLYGGATLGAVRGTRRVGPSQRRRSRRSLR